MEDHGAEGVAQEAQVGADDDGSSEGDDEVVVDPQAARIQCPVAGRSEVLSLAHCAQVPAMPGRQ